VNKGYDPPMDRRVKERLIGATILVVLIVLVVPELLSGPKGRTTSPPPAPTAGASDPVRNVTVDLATSKATPAADSPAASAAEPPTAVDGSETASGTAASGETLPGTPLVGSAGEVETTPPAAASPPGITHAAPPTIATLRAQEAAPPALENAPAAPRSPANGAKPATAAEPAVAESARHGWAVQLGSFASRANADKLVRRARTYSTSVYVSASGKGRALRYRVRVGPLTDRPAAERTMAKLKHEGLPASLVTP
jgi:DedD protein